MDYAFFLGVVGVAEYAFLGHGPLPAIHFDDVDPVEQVYADDQALTYLSRWPFGELQDVRRCPYP